MQLNTHIPIDPKLIHLVARKYSPLGYTPQLLQLLQKVYPEGNFESLTKYELHQLLNDFLLNNYDGEQILKYRLFKQYFSNRHIVAAFEIKVNNSRADFLTINGQTCCFEIKTALDNFSKFAKQAADYMLAFEYNYLVIDECHFGKALDLLPECFGLWVFKNGKTKQIKKAQLNMGIDPEIQLSLLTKQELTASFPVEKGDREKVLAVYSNDIINLRFKKILKDRYRSRWEFIVNNQDGILPVDLQFFFNTNILPINIYFH